MRVFFTVLGLLLAHVATAQVVIQGKVVDVMSRKPLVGAKVQLDKQEVFVQTTADGSFAINNIDPGYHTVTATLDGYESETSSELLFTYDKSPFITLEMQSLASGVGEVTIRKTSIQKREAESPVSSQKLSIREIERNPGGNRDISKIIQSLPGVISVPGFRNDVVIRGGSPSENKFYLDGIEIPIINHFQTQGSTGGPVGLLNVNFIKEVNFYTGAFPVNYANGLSSVLDFRQMDGNANKAKYRFTLGSSDVGFTADGPIGKKTTYIFSARQSYLQGLFSLLGLPFLPNFIDYQAKVKVKLNEKDDISFLMVGAVDFFRLNLKVNDNITDSIQLKSNKYILGYLPVYRQWNYTFGTVYTHYGAQSKTQYFLSRNMLNNTSYKYRNNDESSEDNRIFNYKSIEEENKLRIENSRTLRKWKLLAGTGLEYVQFGVDNKAKILIPGAPGTAGTIQDIAFSTQLDLAKYSGFVRAYRNVMGNGTLSFAGRLDGNTYNKHMQNVLNQPTASVSASLPTPVNGLFFNANVGQFTQLPSQYANYPLALNDSISLGNLGTDFAVVGNEPVSSVCDGRAYGMEFLLQKRSRSGLYGILAYTLSWSEFSDKNGNAVKSAWDSRHTLSLVGGVKLKRNWEMGAKFRLATGRPYTPYDVQRSLVKSNWDVKGVALNDYNRLNTERLGTFSQLDVRVDKVWYFKKSSLNLYMDIQNFLNKEYLGAPTLIAAQDASGNLMTDPNATVPSYKSDYLVNSTGFLQPSIGVILDF